MAINNFKPFSIASGANVLSQADYENLAALSTGFASGKASSAQINKALRQGTVMASVLAQFIADNSENDVLDDGDTAAILTNFESTLTALTPGRLLNTKQFTSSAILTFTPGTKLIRVRGTGGGAGGGGCPACASGQQATAAGGQSGAYAEAWFDVSALTSIAVTIGAAGVGGAAGSNAGTAGGATSLGNLLTIPGGAGGTGGIANSTALSIFPNANGGTLPTVSAGVLVVALVALRNNSQQLALGTTSGSVCGGGGGNSPFGGGGPGGSGTSGGNASGRGAGGGGCSQYSGEAGDHGGNGTPGFMDIEEYA